MATLSTPERRKLDRALADAEEEAAKESSKKDAIGGAIQRAFKYAKGANEFGDTLEKLAPKVATRKYCARPIDVAV